MFRLSPWRVSRGRKPALAFWAVIIGLLFGLSAAAQPVPVPVQPVVPQVVSVTIPDDELIARMEAKGVRFAVANLPQRVVKLGMVKPAQAKSVPKMAKYTKDLKAGNLPASVDWSPKAMASLKRMYLNDRYGCCVISSVYHRIGTWSGNDSPVTQVVPDSVVGNTYQQLKAGPGDSGCVITDVLDYGVRTGYQIADGSRAKLDGYMSVNHANVEQIKAWIYLFGGGPIGIDLPSAWTNGGDGSVWDTTGTRIVGGHDVHVVGYDATGVKISTWGGTRTITWRAFTSRNWITEAWCPLSPMWYGADNLTPAGVNVELLRKDLKDKVFDVDPIGPPPAPPAGTISFGPGDFTPSGQEKLRLLNPRIDRLDIILKP